MPDHLLNLPIVPSDQSLQSHLQTLDLLSLQISSLTSRTQWPTWISLNSKVRFKGRLRDVNVLKVNVGGEWWVEMTAEEASEYVRRRKEALLLSHARLGKGTSHLASGQISTQPDTFKPLKPPVISFNPLFPSPTAAAGPSRISHSSISPSAPVDISPTELQQPEAAPASAAATSTSSRISEKDKATPVTLQDVVEEFLGTQQQLTGKDKTNGSNSQEMPADALVNEEGLPIHEIREDVNGTIIGPAPEPTSDGTEITVQEPKEDYWSAEAKARRAALMRKVFNEESDSDSELFSDIDEAITSDPVTQGPTLTPIPDSPVQETQLRRSPSPPQPPRRASTSLQPPRSILKPPSRKKSVSFDDSVALPPDSPPITSAAGSSKMGFPLPTSEFEPRPVPIIPEPKPAVRGTVSENKQNPTGFAGFKKGFLVQQPQSQSQPTTPNVNGTPRQKGQSLFAQRMAAAQEDDDEPQIEMIEDVGSHGKAEVKVEEVPMGGLPKMSESRPMVSMKSSVIERAPEVDNWERKPAEVKIPAIASGSSSRGNAEVSGLDSNPTLEIEDMEDDEEDEEEEEEDEYDLDDALLAREVALDYHRKMAYQSAALRNDPEGEDDDENGGGGGVILGLPSISSNGQIVNPTPDDLRKYVRIGKLDNGNFVLAPGEQTWSDEEDDEAVQARREAIKKQLLGGPAVLPKHAEPESKVEDVDIGMPPVVATGVKEHTSKDTVTEKVLERPSEVRKAEDAPPKRVSRFKAARMGG